MSTPQTHPVPAAAYSEHIAILGKTGSGKTYAARGIVEQLLDQRRRVCIIDPVGVWWGLRSSADGKSPGYPIIIDLSEMLRAEQHRFMERFATTLFRANRREPLHLVIDETDEFAPERPLPGDQLMKGAIDRIFRRGRARGFRCIAITQRPAVLDKNVLTQAGTLVVFRLPSPQDRDAIKAWVRSQADENEATKMLGSLAGLSTGEGWVWCPAASTLTRAKFPRNHTYDSSATPEHGVQAMPSGWAEIDAGELSATFAAAVEEAKAKDPKALRERVAELEAELRTARETVTTSAQPAHQPDPEDLQAEYQRGYQAALRDAHEAVSSGVDVVGNAQTLAIKTSGAAELAKQVSEQIAQFATWLTTAPVATPAPSAPARKPTPAPADLVALPQTDKARAGGLTGGQRRVLQALAWWASLRTPNPRVEQVAMLARLNPRGGHWDNTIGPLSTGGYLIREGGAMRLTTKGAAAAGRVTAPTTLAEYHRSILSVVEAKNRRTADMLRAIIAAGQRGITFDRLGAAVGINPGGGHFDNTIGPLSTLGLITRRGGQIVPTDLLFPPALGGK